MPPELLRASGLDQRTTLARIQPHRLKALILEDLGRYPQSAISDINRRVGPEIPVRTLQRALQYLVAKGRAIASREGRWRTYSARQSIGHEGNDG